MASDDEHWLEILRANVGFDAPERWIDLARRRRFQKVAATALSACPDCAASTSAVVAQYVYYSTLIRLRRCGNCHLVYADAQLDPEVVRSHFERSYKDEAYFQSQRRAIFETIAKLSAQLAPPGGRVIDVGGAKGHLLSALRAHRPDLGLTLADISAEACAWAERHFGLDTICSPATDLGERPQRYDVVLLIDVAYYEPDIRALWNTLRSITNPGGSVILRVPNTLPLLLARQRLRRAPVASQSNVHFFNPEHIFAFSRRYLKRRLEGLGFEALRILPSPLLARQERYAALYAASDRIATAIHLSTRGRLCPTPSILVTARRRP